METKAQDGTTLLHYLSSTIMNKSPELSNFSEELHSVPSAANVVLDDVRAALRALELDFATAESAGAATESGLPEWLHQASDRLKLAQCRPRWCCFNLLVQAISDSGHGWSLLGDCHILWGG